MLYNKSSILWFRINIISFFIDSISIILINEGEVYKIGKVNIIGDLLGQSDYIKENILSTFNLKKKEETKDMSMFIQPPKESSDLKAKPK